MQHARMNPKDYRFWLNGICLNPKYSFRSLPLDGLLETQATTPTGSSIPASQFVAPPTPHVPTSHVPAPHVPVTAPDTEPLSLKKVFGGLENRTQEQRFLQPSFSKLFEVPRPAMPTTKKKLKLLLQNTQLALTKLQCPPAGLRDELPRYKATDVPLPAMGTLLIDPIGCINLMYQMITVFRMVVLDVDGFYRESSPSFDVLIDENLRDFDYYHDEHQFGGERRIILGQFRDDSECSTLCWLLSELRPVEIIKLANLLSPETERALMRHIRSPLVNELVPISEFWDSKKTVSEIRSVYRCFNDLSVSGSLNEANLSVKDSFVEEDPLGLPDILSKLVNAGESGSLALSALGVAEDLAAAETTSAASHAAATAAASNLQAGGYLEGMDSSMKEQGKQFLRQFLMVQLSWELL
ncbi:hypothetical protein AAG906_011558 [Vitis piasezkii]